MLSKTLQESIAKILAVNNGKDHDLHTMMPDAYHVIKKDD